MAKKKPVENSFTHLTPVEDLLMKPQLRRIDVEVKELNRLNGEITKNTNNMGFVYMGVAYVTVEMSQIAGKNYTKSGIAWPQLDMSLWDRAAAMVKSMEKSKDQVRQVRQYLGLVLVADELGAYEKRNCIPDYLSNLIVGFKDIPRTEPIEDAVAKVPRLQIFYKKIEQSMAVLAAGQLIY